ncbi:MAG: toll/interleukin-1 receptor domain-containing protein [Acidobacteria bacterium]|nr:toll/interleukin-1 receptor domain-containing protein [Acidobacteriota bacterium]
MTFTPGFENDIFISYCHDDNAAPKGKRGRVDHFHDDLESCLVTRFGSKKISIWRDKELQGNTDFNKEIQEKIHQSAIFLAIMSPNYLKSKYCHDELELFQQVAKESECGLSINNESRIINVLIRNIHHTKWPVQLDGASAFPMHDQKKDSDSQGKFLDYEDKQYRETLEEIGYAVEKTLKLIAERIEKSIVPTKEKVAAGKGALSIFIADAADTMQVKRERLVADLTGEQVDILPDIPPPWSYKSHEAKVQNAFSSAALAIHLLDGCPGRKIEDMKSLTYPRSQLEIGLLSSTPQLVWFYQNPEFKDNVDSEYARFLEALKGGPRQKADFEFICDEKTNLPLLVLQKIKSIRQQHVVNNDGKDAPILLDTHEKDQHFAFKLAAYLTSKNIKVQFNPEYRDPASALRNLETALAYARGLIIICGAIGPQWARKRLDITINTICTQYKSTKLLLENMWVCFLDSKRETDEFDNLPPIFKIEFLYNRYSDRPDEKALKPLLKYCKPGGAE